MVFCSARNGLYEASSASNTDGGFILPNGYYAVTPSNVSYDENDPNSLGRIHLRWSDKAIVATLDGSAGTKAEAEISLSGEMDEQALRNNRHLWGNWGGEFEFSFP
ncbi:MAG: hypothetical protein K8E66_05910 [Phycisphaerales bacterium]|nr:hypothetical protein [Phycisphaerales bacterium]